jgi:hypothetical protein
MKTWVLFYISNLFFQFFVSLRPMRTCLSSHQTSGHYLYIFQFPHSRTGKAVHEFTVLLQTANTRHHIKNGTHEKVKGKAVPVLNQLSTTPWRHICIGPYFLDLGTSWRWVVSFTLRLLYPRGKSPRYPLDRRLGGPQSRSGVRGENSWPYLDSN